jgi:uncharacterized repeat protein (TIGR01451 family)
MRVAGLSREAVSRASVGCLRVLGLGLLAFGLYAVDAGAATPAPGWGVHSFATPSNFSTSDNAVCLATASGATPQCDAYQVTVRNAGSSSSDSSTVVVGDALPASLTVQRVTLISPATARFLNKLLEEFGINIGEDKDVFQFLEENGPLLEELFGVHAVCTKVPLRCDLPVSIAPDETLQMAVYLTVDEPATPGTVQNTASASGGGAPEVSGSSQNTLEGAPAAFGPAAFNFEVTGQDGLPDRQAGDHPYELTTRIDLANGFRIAPDTANGTETLRDTSVEDLRDVVVDVPVGFLGNAQATPTCTFAQLSSHISKGVSGCPPDTVLGHILTEPAGSASVDGPIYNMVPEHGVAAEFAFLDNLAGAHPLYARLAPTPAGYVLRTVAPDIAQVSLRDAVVTLFGNPVAKQDELARREGKPASGKTPVAFFTNPSQCSGKPLIASVHMDSWQHPGRTGADGAPDFSDPSWVGASSESPPIIGCNSLQFRAGVFSLQPETTAANSPTGVAFDLQVPQSEQPGILATPPLKKATVTLPAGMIVNPSAASALSSCSPAQIGWLGGSVSNFTAAAPQCPDASKVASVQVTSPLLPGTLEGSVYLASQNDNPLHSLLAAYIVIDDPTTGIVAKIPGKLSLDPGTGQITGEFDENPQLPFSDLELRFFGGPRGEVATPESCGTFTTTSLMSPWSAPESGPEVSLTDQFSITSACVSGFAPAFTAGVASPHAGGYSPFTLSFSRTDSEEDIAGLSVTLPPGLLAKLAGVALCPDAALSAAAANAARAERASPSCPAASQVGTVQAGAGAGPSPFFLPGKAYLTGPYKGAPYGVAVIVPALAGPFDLGTVVIRQALHIDPADAHVTDVSDPLPTILDVKGNDGHTNGFPIRLRRVDVTIDRPNFTLNPTNCNAMAVNGSFTSITGRTAPVSSRFQVGGCRELQFKPRFSASTQANASKANGASLRVKVTSGPGQANIGKARVVLPKQLPSRLTTLQKACPDKTFTANPAGCPAASIVGSATATTPLLENRLTGPAYLVSHGGAAFPDLVIVLQGNGITLQLTGNTTIKHGITISTFNTLPDAPVTTFELTLPRGPHSILAVNLPAKAKYNLCGQKLNMPTTLTGQNNATQSQTTKIAVSGCHARKHHRHFRHSKRH